MLVYTDETKALNLTACMYLISAGASGLGLIGGHQPAGPSSGFKRELPSDFNEEPLTRKVGKSVAMFYSNVYDCGFIMSNKFIVERWGHKYCS